MANDDDKTPPKLEIGVALKQIEEISKMAHSLWFGLLALLGYAFITLLSVEDKDFFAFGAKTTLPILNIGIPTTSFFAFAPFLIAASYIHLHLYLQRLWKHLADLPAEDQGRPIADRVYPWLLTYAALMFRNNDSDTTQAFRGITSFLSFIFLWLASPVVLAHFWWWSMPAHNEWLTLGIGVLLIFATWVGRKAGATHTRLLKPAGALPRTRKSWISAAWTAAKRLLPSFPRMRESRLYLLGGKGIHVARASCFPVAVFIVIFLSWARTEGWMNEEEFKKVYEAEAKADTTDEPSTSKSEDKSNPDRKNLIVLEMLRNFHKAGTLINPFIGTPVKWGNDLFAQFMITKNEKKVDENDGVVRFKSEPERFFGVEVYPIPLASAQLVNAQLSVKPADWKDNDLAEKDYRATHIKRLRDEHGDKWREEYQPKNSEYRTWEDEYKDDWKRVRDEYIDRISTANLEGYDLRGAQLEGAFFANAKLRGAHLDGADFLKTSLEGANLQEAHLEETNLGESHLEGVNLTYSHLEGALLLRAHLEGANLYRAHLEWANLWETHFEKASLFEAHLDGADLSRAYLVGTDLGSASFVGAKLWDAVLCNLTSYTEDQFKHAVGNDRTVLPRNAFCWSCLSELPPLLEGASGAYLLPNGFYYGPILCPKGTNPVKVDGRPASDCPECQPAPPAVAPARVRVPGAPVPAEPVAPELLNVR